MIIGGTTTGLIRVIAPISPSNAPDITVRSGSDLSIEANITTVDALAPAGRDLVAETEQRRRKRASRGVRLTKQEPEGGAAPRHGLHFDQSSQTGVVFHMISSLSECGRVGLTAVRDSPEQAMTLYDRARERLLEDAAEARREGRLPR